MLNQFIPKSSLEIDDFALRVTKTLILKVLSGLTLTLEMIDLIPLKSFLNLSFPIVNAEHKKF